MQTILILAATGGKPGIWHTFLDAIPHVTGMFVVLTTLAVLWGVCALTAWLIKTLIPEPAAAAVESAPPVDLEHPPAAAAVSASGISPEIVAVIAAAVHTAVGKGHKVVAIKTQDSNWEKAGRQSVLGSHRIR